MGCEYVPGFGPKPNLDKEVEFQKDVYGAFTGTGIGEWLKTLGIDEVLITGFYTHGCVSTTSREAIMAGLNVVIDAKVTATCDLQHETLGSQNVAEVRRSALLQLANMGAVII